MSRDAALSAGLRERIQSFRTLIGELQAQVGGGRTGLNEALEMVARYTEWMDDLVGIVEKFSNAEQRAEELALLSQHLVGRAQQVEEWFTRGGSLQIPIALFAAVERECVELGLPNKRAVLAIGRADNLETLQGDLTAAFFGSLIRRFPPPKNLPFGEFAMIQVPRMEAAEGLWWPLTLGHEIAHLKCLQGAADDFHIKRRLDLDRIPVLGRLFGRAREKVPEKREETALRWSEELLCDAYAVFRFGPAGAASLTEFLDVNGDIWLYEETHPPGLLRVKLALAWLSGIKSDAIRGMLSHAESIASASYEEGFSDPDFIDLAKRFESLGDQFLDAVSRWRLPGVPHRDRYDTASREPVLDICSTDLRDGIPPMESYKVNGQQFQTAEEDVVNAGWIVRAPQPPTARLVSKSLDTLEFVRRWTAGGGKLEQPARNDQPPPTEDAPPTNEPDSEVPPLTGVISGKGLRARLDPGAEKRLVVTPLLEKSIGEAGIDLHLGTKFIVFRRSLTPSLKTLDDVDARGMQELIEVGWGETLTLHPSELALAATLEYLALPDDMAAQVVTRSSYGRLGLITATAVQVHPYFYGCLTLELLNLGQIPLQLTPGERVAQLIFTAVSPAADKPGAETFRYATEPEFSRGRFREGEDEILRKMGHQD